MLVSEVSSLSNLLKIKHLKPFGLLLEANEILSDIRQLPIAELRNLIWQHRLIILRNLPLFEREDLSRYCESWGELLTWDFGTVFDVIVHDNPQNYLFTNGNVPFHWDGAFSEVVPSFLFFQCLVAPAPGSGGESLFCDTTKIWETATLSERQQWEQTEITYKTQKVAHYGGQITKSLVSKHPVTGVPTLRFAEPLNEESVQLNPLFLEIAGMSPQESDRLLNNVKNKLYLPENCFAHEWQAGDILIADNHALLHGRNPFFSHSSRHLQRVHIV